MEEYRKLLDACPNQEWRVIIALGHSHKVAETCYLMVTEDDYAVAAGQKERNA